MTSPEWMHDAECMGLDGDMFFPERGDSSAAAKAVCAECTVRAACLDYALSEGIRHGVWGGLSEKERRRLRRQAGGSRRRDCIECGAGFMTAVAQQRLCSVDCQIARRNRKQRESRGGAA